MHCEFRTQKFKEWSHKILKEEQRILHNEIKRKVIFYVKAFIKLRIHCTPDSALIDELKLLVRNRLAGYKAPREIEFVSDFVMTSSGKINRRVLRESELEKSTALTTSVILD